MIATQSLPLPDPLPIHTVLIYQRNTGTPWDAFVLRPTGRVSLHRFGGEPDWDDPATSPYRRSSMNLRCEQCQEYLRLVPGGLRVHADDEVTAAVSWLVTEDMIPCQHFELVLDMTDVKDVA